MPEKNDDAGRHGGPGSSGQNQKEPAKDNKSEQGNNKGSRSG